MKAVGALPEQGLFQLFILHTSAGICINENADSDVLRDFEYILDRLIPENDANYRHQLEGPDDMPAHVKSTLIGHSILIPITNHALNLGVWQGIYLGEFRDRASGRNFVATCWS